MYKYNCLTQIKPYETYFKAILDHSTITISATLFLYLIIILEKKGKIGTNHVFEKVHW